MDFNPGCTESRIHNLDWKTGTKTPFPTGIKTHLCNAPLKPVTTQIDYHMHHIISILPDNSILLFAYIFHFNVIFIFSVGLFILTIDNMFLSLIFLYLV
jgi:hypothetical protein